MKDFNHTSYELHQKKEVNEQKIEGWKNKKSIDYWLHTRMYKHLRPMLDHDVGASWLTVGDGRYGTDGHYIQEHKGKATITDISSVLLELAKKDGYIKDFSIENAEALTFPTGNFDYTLCKEAYHHFPRPMIALYEMLRVSKKGVILMEPNDINIPPSPRVWPTLLWYLGKCFKYLIKRAQGKNPYFIGDYEPTGNYVFSISEREIEKVALGLNLDMVAFLGINHTSETGVEYANMGDGTAIERSIKKSLKKLDFKSNMGISKPNLLIAMLFKTMPSTKILTTLKKHGFEIRQLTKNPYV